MPQGNHVTVAHGRDYSDVTPVKGVALGGGEQIVNVMVEVLPPRKQRWKMEPYGRAGFFFSQ